jgi:hypothetical protein
MRSNMLQDLTLIGIGLVDTMLILALYVIEKI